MRYDIVQYPDDFAPFAGMSCHSLIFLAAFIHEKGFAVSSIAVLSTGIASSSGVTYCVFPGKRKFGYCRLKLNAPTISVLPSSAYKAALNWAIPPLKG